jgi:hypothetical protein
MGQTGASTPTAPGRRGEHHAVSPRKPALPILSIVRDVVATAPAPVTSTEVALRAAGYGLSLTRDGAADALVYLLAAGLVAWQAPNRYTAKPLAMGLPVAMERAFAREQAGRSPL